MKPLNACCLAAALLLTGCDQNWYELVLRPDGHTLNRRVNCWRADEKDEAGRELRDMPQETLDSLAATYGVRPPTAAAARFAFEGDRRDQFETAFGGAGAYRRWESPMGSVSWYAERFGGTLDQAAVLADRQAAANRLIDILDGWLSAEIGDRDGWPELHTLLVENLRADGQNVVLMLWAAQAAQDAGLEADGADALERRLLQHALERGYLRLEEIPAWAAAVNRTSESEEAARTLAGLVAAAAARAAGLERDAGAVMALERLLVPTTLEASLATWLKGTPEWDRRLQEWEAERLADPEAELGEPTEVAEELLTRALSLDSAFAMDDRMIVRLALPHEPEATNGVWDAEAGEVIWRFGLPQEDRLPFVATADWSTPSADAQRRCFGRVLLQGRDLLTYTMWYVALDNEKRREWDTFVDGLRPGPGPAAELERFTFADEGLRQPAAPEALVASAAQPAREVLLPLLTDDDD